jgi:hypothetical protein
MSDQHRLLCNYTSAFSRFTRFRLTEPYLSPEPSFEIHLLLEVQGKGTPLPLNLDIKGGLQCADVIGQQPSAARYRYRHRCASRHIRGSVLCGLIKGKALRLLKRFVPLTMLLLNCQVQIKETVAALDSPRCIRVQEARWRDRDKELA